MSSQSLTSPQTGQTGQGNAPFFEIAEDEQKMWHWCLWSGNGRQLCKSAVGYERRKDCLQALKVVADNAAKAAIVVMSHV